MLCIQSGTRAKLRITEKPGRSKLVTRLQKDSEVQNWFFLTTTEPFSIYSIMPGQNEFYGDLAL
jgi:hypothetical protein